MKSCAIIGNSPILLEKDLGEEIDRHDCVVRFNLARTSGFEKHVGSKCDVRFSNLHPVMCRLSEDHLREHTEFFPEWDNEDILTWKNQELHFKSLRGILESSDLYRHFIANNNKVYHVQESNVTALKSLLGSEPTMGIIGILEMIERNFDSINCYGFDFYEGKGSSHYFERVIKYDTCHDSSSEKSLILSLRDSHRINIIK